MPPDSVLAEWPTSNYVDPVVRGPANLIIIAIFFPLALMIVGIRTYTRIHLSKSFGLDDWFILAALVGRMFVLLDESMLLIIPKLPTTAFAVLTLLTEIHFGWDRHIWDVQLDTIVVGLKVVLGTEILFCLATSLTKISMLTLTYRLVGNSSSLLSKIIVGAITLVSAQGIAFIIVVLFQCQ